MFDTWDEPCRLDIIFGEEFQKSRYANLSSKQTLRDGESSIWNEKLAYS